MRKPGLWLIIVCCCLNTLAIFPILESNAIPGTATSFCGGIDLSSPIAAVNQLARTEAPLQQQLTSRTDPRTSPLAMTCPFSLNTIENNMIRKDLQRSAAACISLPEDDRLLCLRPPGSGAPPGNLLVLMFVVYLIVLARANLPWAYACNCFSPYKPGLLKDRVFHLGGSYEY